MSEPSDADAVTVLEEDECWELLRTEKVGRLVVTADGRTRTIRGDDGTMPEPARRILAAVRESISAARR